MKKTLLAAAAALGLTTGFVAPAMAQPFGPPPFEHPGGWDIQRRIDWTEQKIIRGRDAGALDRREFDRVQGELNGIRREDHEIRRYHDGHLDDRARADLEARLDRVNDQIHWMRDHEERRPW